MSIVEKIDKGTRDIVFVYTICGTVEEARSLGISSIQEKLAISADYWIINSIYPWQGVLQEIGQYMLMLSTLKELSKKLIKHIESEHSYNVPMVVSSNTDMANLPYLHWVSNTLDDEKKYITESDIKEKDRDKFSSLSKLK